MYSVVLRRTCQLALLILSIAVVGTPALSSEPAQELPKSTPQYEGAVRRVLKTHCFQCHGEAGVIEGGLDLRLRRLALKGGESGPAVDPAKPVESLLLQRVVDGEMPPKEVEHRPELAHAWAELFMFYGFKIVGQALDYYTKLSKITDRLVEVNHHNFRAQYWML